MGRTAQPRAVIHKKILEAAASKPNASIGTLADGIGGASPDLVERVLEGYGDPVSSDPGPTAAGSTTDGSHDDGSTADGSDSTGGNGSSPDPASQSGDASEEEGHADSNGDDGDAVDVGVDDPAPGERTLIADGSTNGVDLDRPTNGHDEHGSSASGDDPMDEATADGTTDSTADGTTGSTDDDPTADARDGDVDASDGGGDASGIEAAPSVAAPDDVPTAAGLDETELAILREVARDPTATQAEIANVLDVSRATVSRRVNAVEGFEWAERTDFVDRAFDEEFVDDGPGPDDDAVDDLADSVAALTAIVTDLSDDVERLEAELAGSEADDGDDGHDGHDASADDVDDASADDPSTDDINHASAENIADESAGDAEASDDDTGHGLADPDLAHKVLHACMDAEYVSEDEELRVVRAVLDEGRTS